jgi:cytochrome P450
MNRGKTTIPGPRGNFLLGSIPEIQQDRVKFLLDLQRDYGDVVQIRLGPFKAVVIFHPDGIQHILQDNHANYSKDTRTYAALSALVGNGLISSNGDFWLRQRRLMQPAFHQQQIESMSAMICQETISMLDGWEPFIKNGQTLNVAHEIMRLSLSVATQALFGRKVHDPDRILATSVSFLMTDTAFRFEHPFYPPLWVPASHNREYNAAMKRFDGVIYGMIAERRGHPEQKNDLLGLLMHAREEDNGNLMNDKQLRDEIVTLFIAGHETTALALSWTLYLLSQHPDVENCLREELDEVLAGRTPTLTDLPKLTYLRKVLDESMRLYPPGWLTERKAIADDEIGGYRIPAGTTLAITQYVTHRHPQFWDEPARFDPERFTPQRSSGRPRYAYFPFGGGPRQCIGKNLATLETQLVLAMIVQRCRFHLAPGWEVKTEPELSLRLKGGLGMQLASV